MSVLYEEWIVTLIHLRCVPPPKRSPECKMSNKGKGATSLQYLNPTHTLIFVANLTDLHHFITWICRPPRISPLEESCLKMPKLWERFCTASQHVCFRRQRQNRMCGAIIRWKTASSKSKGHFVFYVSQTGELKSQIKSWFPGYSYDYPGTRNKSPVITRQRK